MGIKSVLTRILPAAATSFALSAGGAWADPLSYNGFNLDAMGLHKSAALPVEPASSLFDLTFNTGGKQMPPTLQPNSLILFPILNASWASSAYDASGHKYSTGGITSNAEILRVVYTYPAWAQPANPHFRLFSDYIMPVMVNVHANFAGNTGAGVGGGSIGDISWAPIALFTLGYNSPNVTFSNCYDFVINFPVGSYSKDKEFNVGSNEYSFTMLLNPIFTFPKLNNFYVESQLHYTHVIGQNNDFRVVGSENLTAFLTGVPTSSYKTGDLFTANFDTAYPITDKLTFGPTFSVMDQLSNDQWNGQTVHNSGIFALGAGVSMQYQLKPLTFRVKYSRSFSVRNMPQYNVVWAEFSLPFRL
jgi:hypothetical protein